VAVKQI